MPLVSRKGILAIAAVIDVALNASERPVSAKAQADFRRGYRARGMPRRRSGGHGAAGVGSADRGDPPGARGSGAVFLGSARPHQRRRHRALRRDAEITQSFKARRATFTIWTLSARLPPGV